MSTDYYRVSYVYAVEQDELTLQIRTESIMSIR